jgi:hypothetical protein
MEEKGITQKRAPRFSGHALFWVMLVALGKYMLFGR